MSVVGLTVTVFVSVAVWTFLAAGLVQLVQEGLRKVRLSFRRAAPRRSAQRAG